MTTAQEELDGGPVVPDGHPLAPGYRVVQHIARGDALDVYEVFSEQRLCSCIAKTVRPDRVHQQRVLERLAQEGRLLTTLSHPHLLRGFETVGDPVPVVITQTVPAYDLATELEERTRRPPAIGLAYLTMHLCSAVHYLHGQGFLHLDVRPANVVVNGGLATLIDLSLARPPGPAPRGVGTREYLSPEQARGDDLTAAADVWGVAVTVYEVATGTSPFAPATPSEHLAVERREYVQLLRPAPPLRRLRRGLPQSFARCLEQALAPDPADRPGVHELWASASRAVDQLTPADD